MCWPSSEIVTDSYGRLSAALKPASMRVQVTPLSVERYMPPAYATATRYLPSAEMSIEIQRVLAGRPPVAPAVQVRPLSRDVIRSPGSAPAASTVPSAFDATQ